MAFREIYADNAGQYKLCCHAKYNNDLKKYNSSNTLPFEFFTSEEMENIRNDMFEGKLIDDCEVCYNLEKLTGKSHRTLKQLEKYRYDTELKNIELKQQSNTGIYIFICLQLRLHLLPVLHSRLVHQQTGL